MLPQGKQQEAIIQYSNAIKIDKNYAAAHYDLAKAYMKLGAFAAGYQELQRTVALDPNEHPGEARSRLSPGRGQAVSPGQRTGQRCAYAAAE